MKLVKKPWGQEVWLELNDKYCYKCLQINAGHRTSLQYHNTKLETMHIISGQAEVIIGKARAIMGPGDLFTIQPNTVHRVKALTDLVLHEVSTPEVDDVMRLEDDYVRND